MGEAGITISDKKTVKVDVFEDEDLLSEEEKAAMAEEDDLTDEEAQAKQAAIDDAEKQKSAQEDADAKAKQDAIKEADAKIAEEKAKADEEAAAEQAAAAAEADKKGKTPGEGGGKESEPAGPEVIVPETPPPLMVRGLDPQQKEKLGQDLSDIEAKFQDGEIDYKEYFDKRLEIERTLWADELSTQLSADGVEQQWQWEQETFLSAEDNAWINDDDVVYSAFAATVNRIMATEEGQTMPGPQLLDQARTEVAARFSPTMADDKAQADEEKKKAAALKGAKDKQANKDIPQTLADIPAAEAEEGAGEFDWIDKLEGEAYEKAVESLSEAQLARYQDAS